MNYTNRRYAIGKAPMNFAATRANYICVYFDLLAVRADLFKKVENEYDALITEHGVAGF